MLPHLQRLFKQLLAAGMVTAAAPEARDQHLLRPQDRVLMKRAHLLHEAKRSALCLADGYRAPQPEPVYAAGVRSV